MQRRFALRTILGVFACVSLLASASPAVAQWQIATEDGSSSIKFGYLAVMRADSAETETGDDLENLYFRRLRLLFGGNLSPKWSYFFETDSPNLGKTDASGVKNAEDVFIQDFYVTYTQSDAFKLDFGLILIPLSRNSTQSAATHLPSDYGPHSFLSSGPTQSRIGRDYGVQARGGLANNKLEYRLGVYDGNRALSDDLRFAGRLMYHVFDAEPAMFYTGNNLGAKRMLSFGAGFDVQDDYQALGFDVFYDQPVGANGAAITFQADAIQYDGGDTYVVQVPPELPEDPPLEVALLPEQDTFLVELGYLFPGGKWQPWVQYAERDFDDPLSADTDWTLVGVNYRLKGHNRLLRLAYGKSGVAGGEDSDLIELTLQLFQF